MKEMLWNSFKIFMGESVFNDMWKSLCSLIMYCLTGAYSIAFYVLIILCMYNIILAVFGSKKGKIGIVKTVMIWAMIEMVATLIGVA